MKVLWSKIREKENLPFIAFAICIILIHCRIHLVTGSDDDFMATSIKTGNLTQLFANNRIVLNFLGSFIMSLPLIIWKIFNISILMLFMLKLANCASIITPNSNKGANTISNWGVCFLFFLLPFNVLSTGIFWVTGSFNYFWGLFGSVFICMIFIKDMAEIQISSAELITGLILGIYACDSEQSMVIICIGGVTYLTYCFFNHKKICKRILLYGIVLILECMPIIFLPFNSNRSRGEQASFYPDFGMLTFFDKTYQGLMHYYNHLVNKMTLIFFLIALFTAILVYKNIQSIMFRILSTLPLLYFLFILLRPITALIFIPLNFAYDFTEKLYFAGMEETSFLPFFFATFIFILLFFTLLHVLKTSCQKYTISFFYLSAFATGVMMSFAPSIFVSGNRVFFASDLFFLAVTFILGKIAIANINISKTGEKLFSCIAFYTMLFFSLVMGVLQNNGVYY